MSFFTACLGNTTGNIQAITLLSYPYCCHYAMRLRTENLSLNCLISYVKRNTPFSIYVSWELRVKAFYNLMIISSCLETFIEIQYNCVFILFHMLKVLSCFQQQQQKALQLPS